MTERFHFTGIRYRNWAAMKLPDSDARAAALKLSTMAKSQSKQLVEYIENTGYPGSLENRKIYLSRRDAVAEKHGLIRIFDESGDDFLYSKGVLPLV
jgi:hypothetical protein